MGKKRKRGPRGMGRFAQLLVRRRNPDDPFRKYIETLQGAGHEDRPKFTPRYSGPKRCITRDHRVREAGEISNSASDSDEVSNRRSEHDEGTGELTDREDRRSKKQKISFETRPLENVSLQSHPPDGENRRRDITPDRRLRREGTERRTMIESSPEHRGREMSLGVTIDNKRESNSTKRKAQWKETGDYERRDGPVHSPGREDSGRKKDQLKDVRNVTMANNLEKREDEPGCSFWNDEQRAGSEKDTIAGSDSLRRKSRSPARISSPEHTVSKRIKVLDNQSNFSQTSNRQEGRLYTRHTLEKRIQDLASDDLKRLSSQEEEEALLWLASRTDRLRALVDMTSMSPEEVQTLLQILARACRESTHLEGTLQLVLSVVAESKFLVKYLPESVTKVSLDDKTSRFVRYTCILCSSILQHFPGQIRYVAFVANLLFSQIAKQGSAPTDDQFRKIVELNAECTATLCKSYIQDRLVEVNRFRDTSIIPQTDEIRFDVKPKLNPNLKNGAYENVDTYLDTQFRLLREDFVAPLRTGICSFIKQQHMGKTGRRLDDVRVYHGAVILHPVCGSDGVSYRVQFNRGSWSPRMLASNKLLRYGSLVCLSADGFETVYFGVVTNRDSLSRGIIDVQLQTSPKDSSIYECKYTMVESEAFFEAYRPVLKGLQQINHDTLPLQKYIIKTSRQVSPPLFLQRSPEATFDFLCLDDQPKVSTTPDTSSLLSVLVAARSHQLLNRPISPPSKTDEERALDNELDVTPTLNSTENPLEIREKEIRENATKRGVSQGHNTPNGSCLSNMSKVPLLEYDKWPDGTTIGLDESQRRAFYGALTQEMTIIQGPPGTGKTYVGLKIMKVLLENREVWSGDRKDPILVVCYTNHALDQFLEGVLQFETDIVRIGSRSKSEKLEKYNLKNVRYAKVFASQMRQGRDYYFRIKKRLFGLRDEEKKEMENKTKEAMTFEKEIVSFQKLKCVMSEHHVNSLLAIGGGEGVMSKWLELHQFTIAYSNSNFRNSRTDRNKESQSCVQPDVFDERQLDDELDTSPNLFQIGCPQTKQSRTEDFVLQKFISMAENIEEPAKRKSKLKAAEIIEGKMGSSERMIESEAASVRDVWRLSPEKRWELYRYWVHAYRLICLCNTVKHACEYDRYTLAIKDIENEEVYRILRNVNVIGMTTTGAARCRSILQRVRPRIVVVEEAAEVMEAHVITTLSKHCEHLILIGDHQQLRPNPAVYRLAKQYNLDISLFERMINNSFPYQTLTRQHRMRPEIAEIMKNHFYPDLQDDPSVLSKENVRGVSTNIFFLNHKYIEDSNDDGMKSHSSEHEADFTVALCNYLLQQGYSPSQVTILTVYTGQLLSIRSKLAEREIKDVRIAVVDNYQGEECDIILLSLVRSNEEGKIGFLQTHNRICVMLSRARMGLFCVGNFDQLASQSEKWKAITNDVKQKQFLGNFLVLACSLHPGVETKVNSASDFKMVPQGGCNRLCEFRLSCGHVCSRLCHPDDRSHEQFKCDKPCEREICKEKHKCQNLCGEECSRHCERKVKKRLPRCGHDATLKCYSNPDYFDCEEKCEKKLPCGHGCRNSCGKPCTISCLEKVLRTDLPCGHKETLPCSHKSDQCPAPCSTILACDHKCPGKCSFCLGGRLHASCRLKCGRILVCGHKCRDHCTGNCPPCQNPCDNRCLHSKCPKKCCEPCSPCQEPCRWRCSHYECSKKCSEPCDRPPCDRPCKRVLACKHPCIGMCGEPCPSLCRVCNSQEVTEILFGNEDEDDVCFVQLKDCQHVIEVSGLDQWMMQDSESFSAPEDGRSSVVIQLKSCPKCKTPIRRSTRYNGIINRTLADVETIKGHIFGNTDLITQRKREIDSLLPQVKQSGEFREPGIRITTRPLQSVTASLYDLTVLLNQTNFALEVIKLKKQLNNVAARSKRKDKTEYELCKVGERLFNPLRPFRGTEQELIDFPQELRRLTLCYQACAILDTSDTPGSSWNREDLQTDIDNVDKLLYSGKPLTSEMEKEVRDELDKLRKSVGGLGVDNKTRIMIVKAIGLSKGHWYKCPNGHVYAIGECGGAMQQSVCPECKASIGGTQHQLTSGNTVAPEMDGAQFSAWSEQANLENYEL